MESRPSQQFDDRHHDSEQEDYYRHETRPIQGHNWTPSVPLLKDERPWIRWPIYLFYKLPLSVLQDRLLRTAATAVIPSPLLSRLTWYQIFIICIGSTVGIGFAISSGEILAIAGPGGTLIAYTVVGVVVIFVMEGICEMTSLWPISNAMTEFVRAFVDEDLAIVVGLTYWYAYCCTIPALIVGAGSMLQYFNISRDFLDVVYLFAMLYIFAINCSGIAVIGKIEFWAGIIKLLLLFCIFILMICINQGIHADHYIGSTAIADGVRNNPNVAGTNGIAVLVAIPLAVFSYVGVDVATVTALEAANPRALSWTAKNIAYITLMIYVIVIEGICANVEWFDGNLPQYYSQSLVPLNSSLTDLGHTPIANQSKMYSTSIAIAIATLEAGSSYITTTSVFLGLLVCFALSCATTSLYCASRALYSLSRGLDHNSINFLERYLSHLNIVTPKYRVPLWSVIASSVLGAWVPFVSSQLDQMDLFIVISSIASEAVLLVWASQCLAFIRYNKWLWIHKDQLIGDQYERLHRWPRRNGLSSYLAALQPIPAYLGLVSCLAIVLIFSSACIWNGNKVLLKGLSIYSVPTFSLLLLLFLKLIRRRGWVEISEDWVRLRDTIGRLDAMIHGGDTTQQNGARMRGVFASPLSAPNDSRNYPLFSVDGSEY